MLKEKRHNRDLAHTSTFALLNVPIFHHFYWLAFPQFQLVVRVIYCTIYISTTGHLFCCEISSNIVVFLYKKKVYFPFFPNAGSPFSVFIPFNFIIAFSTTNSFHCLDSVRMKQSRLCPTTYMYKCSQSTRHFATRTSNYLPYKI